MITRREYLKLSLAAGTALAVSPRLLMAADDAPMSLITRAIPGTTEQLPVVGLGSSATFSRVAGSADVDALREVLKALHDKGGHVFDTAPSYGASEKVAAELARELGITESIFWATKLNVAPRGGGKADEAAARAQVQTSFEHIGKRPVDLIQVHNMGDPDTQLGILKENKAAGRVRYIGITTTFAPQYEHLQQVMREQPLDFIGVEYAIDNRTMEETIFPLAQEKGIGVLVYAPFGRTRLWQAVRGKTLPEWASEFDASSWGQFFLKFVVSNPAVTVATPATSKARHMIDNMGAAMGRLPDKAMRKRMIAHVESL
ncbi:MAG TPA: aldo/keto reductase [Dokdonella sp.]|uniref:aldo/keto reductase n=1 Tax=Dokdonella sp. TaxID=2291710 RepID=UPI002D7F1B7C|nr:aldo/keto reductase [Dokdonella sp.]HET9032847.1 aldo/keto reductase [Dokdonella sp.]